MNKCAKCKKRGNHYRGIILKVPIEKGMILEFPVLCQSCYEKWTKIWEKKVKKSKEKTLAYFIEFVNFTQLNWEDGL